MTKATFEDSVLQRLLIRKEHVLCTRCGAIEPVHPGDGIPALAYIQGITRLVELHAFCKAKAKSQEGKA